MRILVVDDDVTFASLLRGELGRRGHVVEVEHDGEGGCWRAFDEEFDVVVLDLSLPRMSGSEVLHRLRSGGRATPVLVLTACDSADDHVDALAAGADDYLCKPVSVRVLDARLRLLGLRRSSMRPGAVQAGDVSFDPWTRRVTRGGVEVELTARETALLEFLLGRGGAVVTKAQILEHVWDGDFAGDTNVVEVYVGYLRRKLGRGIVATVRGQGYRVAESSAVVTTR